MCSLPRPFFPLFLFVSTSVQRVSVYCRMAVHAERYEVHWMSCASHGTRIQVVYLDVLCAVAERAAVAVSAVDLAWPCGLRYNGYTYKLGESTLRSGPERYLTRGRTVIDR